MSYSVFDDGILCDCVSKQGRWDSMEEVELGHFICVECEQEVFAPFVSPGSYEREEADRVIARNTVGIRRMNLTYMGERLKVDPAVLFAECQERDLISGPPAVYEAAKVKRQLVGTA